jgi:hypothetical protein
MNDTNLKSINVIKYNGKSVDLNSLCMSHTNFQPEQILEAFIYNDMIVIAPAMLNTQPAN